MTPLPHRLYHLLVHGQRDEARSLIGCAIETGLDEDLALQAASVCIEGAAVEEARALLDYARTLRPNEPERLFDLAAVARMAGDLDGARLLCREALTIEPTHVSALALSVELARGADLPPLVTRLEDLARLPHPPDVAARIDYARAQAHHRLGDFEAAFMAATRGGRRLRERINYDVQADVAAMDAIRRTQSREMLRPLPKSQHPDAAIFVCGLPRTGTTLVEQIVLRGGDAAPVGESSGLSQAIAAGVRALSPPARSAGEALSRLQEIDVRRVGALYRDYTALPRGGAARTLDKALLNFLSAGLIGRIFPRSRTILLERDPRDCVASIFRVYFGGLYPFALNPLDLAHYVAAFRRLVEHWRATLDPDTFMTLKYEDLVRMPETRAEDVCAFLGIAWSPARLDPEKAVHAPIATSASAVQVRAPVHDRSVGAWRDYAPWLEHAFEVASA